MPLLTLTVGESAGDADELESGTVSINSATTNLEEVAGKKKNWAARFTNVTIPQGATITAAHLEVFVLAAAAKTTMRAVASASAEDNAAALETTSKDITTGHTWTSAEAEEWIATMTKGAYGSSPSLKTAVQAVINRAGWKSGNAIAIRLLAQAECNVAICDWDTGSGEHPAKLVIEYEEASGKTKTLTASLSFAGALPRSTAHGLTASLTPSGFMAKAVSRSSAASLSFSGVVNRMVARTLSAALSMAGTLAATEVGHFVKHLAATLTPSGALSRSTGRATTASLTFAGSVGRAVGRSSKATLTFAGAVRRSVAVTLAASLAFAGRLARGVAQALKASLSFLGHLVPHHEGGEPEHPGHITIESAKAALIAIASEPTAAIAVASQPEARILIESEGS